jgi:prepilin-type N-terminal cleavage/methylation domain-containing protein
MKRVSGQQGFTIVETIVVLAVVGVLFVATALSVQGSINSNKQKDAIAQLESGLRSTLNDVTNGKYSSGGTLLCDVSATQIIRASISQGTSNLGQGNGKSCVYAGKRIIFSSNSYSVESYATLDTDTNALAHAILVQGSKITTNYINGMKLKSISKDFYIANQSYGSSLSGSFASGTQDVSFYTSLSPTSKVSSDITVCFTNTSVISSLVIGANNSLSTNLVEQYAGTVC